MTALPPKRQKTHLVIIGQVSGVSSLASKATQVTNSHQRQQPTADDRLGSKTRTSGPRVAVWIGDSGHSTLTAGVLLCYHSWADAGLWPLFSEIIKGRKAGWQT